MIVAVISYKRADSMITTGWLKSAKVIVPNSQVSEYQDYNPEIDIVGIPDEKDGNVVKKRNAVLELYPNENVIIMDDDINYVGYIEGGRTVRASEEMFLEFAENMFEMIEEMGTVLWGVGLQKDPRFYHIFAPFSLSSVVLGPLMGIRNIDPELKYDLMLPLKEDYDFSLQVLKKYRKILRCNKWHYDGAHISNKGGILGMRTSEKELENALLLQQKWGSKIVDIGRKTQHGNVTINPIVRCPIKGI